MSRREGQKSARGEGQKSARGEGQSGTFISTGVIGGDWEDASGEGSVANDDWIHDMTGKFNDKINREREREGHSTKASTGTFYPKNGQDRGVRESPRELMLTPLHRAAKAGVVNRVNRILEDNEVL